jgi:hypothetical protein
MQVKRFNWVRPASGWERFQAWQERRRAMREDFEAANAAALSGFGAAWSNAITGASNLAGQAALDRVNAAAHATLDKVA